MHDERHMNIANALREGFGLPQDWVSMYEDTRDGEVVAIALNMHAHESGDGESGPCVSFYPTRYAHVFFAPASANEHAGWYVALYDNNDEGTWDGFDQRPVRTIRLGRTTDVAVCAMNLLVQRVPSFAIEMGVIAE